MSGRRFAVTLILALCAGSSTAQELVSCAYSPAEVDADLVDQCAARTADGSFTVSPEAIREHRFGAGNLAEVMIDKRLHWVNRRGRAVQAFVFDNGADYFVEGLARTVRDGKVGFVNEALELVVPPTWDFALPFSDGTAMVCLGCVRRPVTDRPHEEHFEMVGGRWGYIDTVGKVVVPVEYEKNSVPRPVKGQGQRGDA